MVTFGCSLPYATWILNKIFIQAPEFLRKVATDLSEFDIHLVLFACSISYEKQSRHIMSPFTTHIP